MAFDADDSDHNLLYDNGLSDADLVEFATQHEQLHFRDITVENDVKPQRVRRQAKNEFDGFDDDDDYDDDDDHDHNSDHITGYYGCENHDIQRGINWQKTSRVASHHDGKQENDRMRLEIERLTRELVIAKEQLETKNGEVATIRRKLSRADEIRLTQIIALRNDLDEAKRHHREELERVRKEQEKLRDHHLFLQHDLQTMSHDRETISRKTKYRADEAAPSPSKAVSYQSLGEGFEDEDIGVVSKPEPKQYRDNEHIERREATATSKLTSECTYDDGFKAHELMTSPSRPLAKRQRQVPARPTKANHQLELSQPRQETTVIEAVHDVFEKQRVSFINGKRASLHMRKILNHRSFPRKERDLEILARHHLPSDSHQSVLSIILGQLLTCPHESFVVAYAKSLISILQRCITEKVYEIVGLLMDMLFYIINNRREINLVPRLIDDLVPALMSVCLVNADQRYFASPTHQEKQREDRIKQGHPRPVRVSQRPTPKNLVHPEVSSTQALTLMQAALSACLGNSAHVMQFWRCIRWDFVYKMLNSYQLLADLELVITILEHSIRPTSLGPLLATYEMQVDNERIILERAAHLLHEPLSADEGSEPYGPEVSAFRLRVMQFLLDAVSLFPDTPHTLLSEVDTGKLPTNHRVARLILQHHAILPHIFNSIHDELIALYLHAPDAKRHANLINGLVRLAYSVLHAFTKQTHENAEPLPVQSYSTTTGDYTAALQIDLPAKLRASTIRRIDGYARSQLRGVARKFLVSMTRIAFSERLVLDAAIEEETVNMCNEMLDECLNPQEAECLLDIFREKGDCE
ncbi:hypothetical protein KEM54_000351 [Ascosphaera aggregata]|nr:hypothetical protein KEM54_000351 [Ascosphaera aggregata]